MLDPDVARQMLPIPTDIATADENIQAPPAEQLWNALVQPRKRSSDKPVSWRPVIVQVVLTAILVVGLVVAAGIVEEREASEREAVDNATQATGVLVHAAVQPAIADAFLTKDANGFGEAYARLDDAVRGRVLTETVVRVKLWTQAGRVVYSDEPRLIDQVFPLAASEIEALRAASSVGGVSDLQEPENKFERASGRLVEVYYPVWTPSGEEMLFETYMRYDRVVTHNEPGIGSFASIAIGALLIVLMVQMPMSWGMIARLRRVQQQRHHLLASALTASAEERRRIAGTLHDGVVQDLAAASFMAAGSADQVRGLGQEQIGERMSVVADMLRTSIRALRSLLVDIYPPNLRAAGLSAAFDDLAATLSTPQVQITITIEPGLTMNQDIEALMYGVAQECLRNAVRHAQATTVVVEVARSGPNVRLEVSDDGVGFDPQLVINEPGDGHFGLRVIRDLAADYGAFLAVDSRPGLGTRWRLEVPADEQ
jgi:signal transduction histidine kinase